MNNRDNRRWVKVCPRNFSNQYFFVGFENKEQTEKFINKVNNEQDSSAYRCRKSKVEQIYEFEEVIGYFDLKGIYTIYGTEIDISDFIDCLK